MCLVREVSQFFAKTSTVVQTVVAFSDLLVNHVTTVGRRSSDCPSEVENFGLSSALKSHEQT